MPTVYIAYGFHIQDGQASAFNSRQFTDLAQAERQYYLYCAAACVSEYPIDNAVLMTGEGFILKQETWKHGTAAEPAEAE